MKKYVCLFLLLGLILGMHNGYLAIYEGTASPPQVLPYRVAMYPKLDQYALASGIPVSSQDELSRLLEDFLS